MMRKSFIIGNVLLLLIFLAAIGKDSLAPYLPHGWAHYQMVYRKRQAAEESSDDAKKADLARPVEIKQILATDLGQVDRCISCHQGMDSLATPTLANSFSE